MGHFGYMNPYRLVNPAAGNDYFDKVGAATDASNQPDLNKGRSTGLGTGGTVSVGMTDVPFGDRQRPHYGSKVVGGISVGSALWSNNSTTITSVAASTPAGFSRYTLSSHGLDKGAIINVTDTNSIYNGPQRITRIVDANTFETDKPGDGTGEGTLAYYSALGTFATMTAGAYVMRKVTTTLAGQSNTMLRSGASDFGVRRSIHKLEHLWTLRVATAIRAGFWHIYSGVFTTAPTNADDASTMGTDDAANPTLAIPGELVYRTGDPLPTQDDYQARQVG